MNYFISKRKNKIRRLSFFFLGIMAITINFIYAGTLENYFDELVDKSPHPPGSKNHLLVKKYLKKQLKKNNAVIEEQLFQYDNPYIGLTNGYNIIAFYRGNSDENIVFCSHWDTRPAADKEKNPNLKKKPIVGANDGNSSTAVLLKLSEYLNNLNNLKHNVYLLFFDAEDSGKRSKDYCLGSKYFVNNYNKIKIKYGILIDMIGDKNLVIEREGFSDLYASKLTDSIWRVAKEELGYSFFKDKVGYYVMDDHYYFLKKNIPVVNIIDFDYKHWHKLSDTKENCSVNNMKKILNLLKYIVNNPEKIKISK
ncbi:MAG: M28 family peptidase [Candidatus Mcinerneyibacterium aminivorans]|uniref:M28 family peptidase n=1 Tax=Candidatus Mcinerneyibacterium aminivorans TaxID=2703815 RepID=A0A5D0MHI2_9BACT|nr:MAG: M28 family peptidase [Candidatus Mcinerneyibacterium aminivorans]